MTYRVVLTREAADDFRKLDGSIKLLVAKQLRKLESSPELGDALGVKMGYDLSGYRKLYVAKKSIRIVYRIVKQEIVVEVVGIGRRADMAVYAEIVRRLLKLPEDRKKSV